MGTKIPTPFFQGAKSWEGGKREINPLENRGIAESTPNRFFWDGKTWI